MTITQLNYFLDLSEELNFTRVAEKHFISQTAVTQQIRALETDLGFSLFTRTNHKVRLTPAGMVYKREISGILLRLKEAQEKAKAAEEGFTGTMSVGFLQGMEITGITELFQNFSEKYPDVSLSFHQRSGEQIHAGLKSGDLDIAFSYMPFSPDPALHYEVYKKIPLYAVLPQNHTLAYKSALKREELVHETLLILAPAAENILYGYELAGVKPEKMIRVDDVSSILLMAGANMGIAILPEYNLRAISGTGFIRQIPIADDQEEFRIAVIYYPENENPSVPVFLKSFSADMESNSISAEK